MTRFVQIIFVLIVIVCVCTVALVVTDTIAKISGSIF